MTEQEIIKALMENTSGFGLMSAEMRAKADSLPAVNLWEKYQGGKWVEIVQAVLLDDYIYRLRPDYEPEPEVVKCEVELRDEELKYCYNKDSGIWMLISQAVNDPAFIGFLYEDGQVSSTTRRYVWSAETKALAAITDDHVPSKRVGEVLTPTHVLFSKKD